ncbi:hypothetical protein NPIL_577681 [Nephila pilipes]|uniref:Secreted protein n=1 Tax=Nephila pilipes TaxID=299642 RepID=A0A8X6QSU8_NEPPI|nr:hypothetical protein NPIL_577681 [Nephila pilipes]
MKYRFWDSGALLVFLMGAGSGTSRVAELCRYLADGAERESPPVFVNPRIFRFRQQERKPATLQRCEEEAEPCQK